MCLKITVNTRKDKELPRIWIKCPACKHTDWYYTLWIESCDLCGFHFGDISNIRRDLNRRLKFHVEGFEPKKELPNVIKISDRINKRR